MIEVLEDLGKFCKLNDLHETREYLALARVSLASDQNYAEHYSAKETIGGNVASPAVEKDSGLVVLLPKRQQ